MLDTQKYKDIRFSDDFNCSSFVKLVLKDHGYDYPVDFVNHEDQVIVAQSILDKKPLFRKVSMPQDFDIIYMKESDGRRHLGIYFNYGKIYHLKREGSPVYQKITTEIKNSILGFYRIREKDNA